jgi:hypothetical protein
LSLNFFKLQENGTNIRTEVLAGITTFLTMAYILIVNPLILGDAGMDMGSVFMATAISSAIATFVGKQHLNNYFRSFGIKSNEFREFIKEMAIYNPDIFSSIEE